MNESNVLTSRDAQTCLCVIDRGSEQAHATPPVHTDARLASLLKQPANHTNYCLQLALWYQLIPSLSHRSMWFHTMASVLRDPATPVCLFH